MAHGHHRAFHRVRYAGTDGLRRGPRHVPGRGGQGGRRSFLVAGLRSPLRRHSRSTKVTTSMTINALGHRGCSACTSPSPRSRAFRMAEARRHHPERHAQGVHRAEGVDRPTAARGAHRRRHDRVLHADACRAGTRCRISGYHIREAGATAVQELAFTLADGIGYVEAWRERGPRLSTSSRPGCPSSGTSTTTSSRRSPSSARRAASGRGSCASVSGPRSPQSWQLRDPRPDRGRVA